MIAAAATPEEERPFFSTTRFTGTLSSGSKRIDCALAAEIASDGGLYLRFEEISFNENTRFFSNILTNHSSLPLYSIDVVSESGYRLLSEEVQLLRAGHNFSTNTAVSGHCVTAKIVKKREESDRERITWWLRGFRTLRGARADTPFGSIEIDGPDRDDTAKINSSLQLLPSPKMMADGKKRNELSDFLEHVLWLMSFASGTMLRNPVRVMVYGDILETEIRKCAIAPAPIYRPIEHSNQRAMLNHAVRSYFDRFEACKEMRVAIEFLLMGFDYTEARLMMNAIAIEFLTNKYLAEDEQKQISLTDAKRIKSGLRAALRASSMSTDDRNYDTQAVGDANRLSFGGKIEKLIAKWQIPILDLPENTVQNLVNVRNAVAHGRLLKEDGATKDIHPWEMVLAIREPLTRAIFMRIGFVGHYQSYVGTWGPRDFPSCRRL